MSRQILLTSDAYGRRVGLRLGADLTEAVRPLLPWWWLDRDVEPERVWEVPNLEDADFQISMLELWVAEWAHERIFVHAAVVCLGGGAIVIPGRSMSGKTTLAVELLRRGAEYLSDEFAVIRKDGLIEPYPRDLSVRSNSGVSRIEPASLGTRTRTEPTAPALVVNLPFRAGRPLESVRVGPSQATLTLLDNTVCAKSRHAEALRSCAIVAEMSTAIRGFHGDARIACEFLVAQLSC